MTPNGVVDASAGRNSDPSRHIRRASDGRWACKEIVAVSLLGIVISALLLAWWPGWSWIGAQLSKPDAPAWAQAMVSSLAILAGAAAIAWQVREQERQRRKDAVAEEVRRLQLLGSALVQCRITAGEAKISASRAWSNVHEMNKLASQVSALERVDLLDVPDAKAAFALANVISSFVERQAAMKSAPLDAPRPAGSLHETEHIDGFRQNLLFSESLIYEALEMRGAQRYALKIRLTDGVTVVSSDDVHPPNDAR